MSRLPRNTRPHRDVGSVVQACSGTLVVELHYGNDADVQNPYLKDSGVKVGGSVTVTVKSSKATRTAVSVDGVATFEDLPCATYAVTATYVGASALVDAAVAKVASKRWGYRVAVTSYDSKLSLPANTNKCSFFIYDMIQQTYGSAPIYTYARRFTFGLWTRDTPPLAGHWAERDNGAGDKTKGWRDVTYTGRTGVAVAPGAILAISADYSDATGHVGIIGYPRDGTGTGTLRGGRATVTVVMPGRTISATDTAVVHNDWGFRTSSHPEKNSLNAPRAGIEVRK
jgi:hypothetical protein